MRLLPAILLVARETAMLRKFIQDIRGNMIVAGAVAMIPAMGAVALAVDFSEMNRHKAATLHALDAAGIATARQILKGDTDAEVKAFAKDFFEANLGPVAPANTTLTVELPNSSQGGGLLKLAANLKYKPHFLPAFSYLLGHNSNGATANLDLQAESQIRLKNTIEVALVLDNSGSMSSNGHGSSQDRIDLLKDASKQLIDQLAAEAAAIQQVSKPVQFAVVPFSATVNVGNTDPTATWLDQDGLSPIHHENFDWTTLNGGATNIGGIWYDGDGNKLTRWRLYDQMKYVSSYQDGGTERRCRWYYYGGRCGSWRTVHLPDIPVTSPLISWRGCVEARGYPYNVNDATPTTATPATLYVPTFAPDEPGNVDPYYNWGAANNWWNDYTNSSNGSTRQKNMQKYFEALDDSSPGLNDYFGPGYSCTTNPITPLMDVTVAASKTTVKAAIDAMSPTGYTNVPEGIAWGWRVLSSKAPFTEGRSEVQKGNDKAIIVLTDGMNTYEDLGSTDPAGNKSKYAAYGYTGKGYDGGSVGRLFLDTSNNVGNYDYSYGNYSKALDENMEKVCANAKAEKIIVFTVALDLNPTNDAAMISAMSNCSSESRLVKGKKLFWNAKGSDLDDVFRAIAEELSNLRIVG